MEGVSWKEDELLRITTGYKPGSILELPLDILDDNPCNPRRFYLQESIDRLAINLSNIGQQSLWCAKSSLPPLHCAPLQRLAGR
jgi:hypothetical protein